MILKPVYAANYKMDNFGNYYVKEAACTYRDNSTKGYDGYYRIVFKNASISKVERYDKNFKLIDSFNSNSYKLDSLTYIDFFENKQFACPSEVYVDITRHAGVVFFYSSC